MNFRKMTTLAAVVIAVAATMIAAGRQPKIFNGVATDEMNLWVDTTIARLTLDEKIAQLMVMHITPSTQPGTLDAVKKAVEKYKIGGLLYSSGDIMSPSVNVKPISSARVISKMGRFCA